MGAQSPSLLDRLLGADAVREGPLLPGGLWLMVACFAAGTPSHSAFEPWLAELLEHDAYAQRVERIHQLLPRPGEPPFLAAMPLAALANPQGPLAIVGHVDLAWTFAYLDAQRHGRGRPERIFGCLRAMVRGSRAGVALDALMRSFREVNDELLLDYEAEATALDATAPGRVTPAAAPTRSCSATTCVGTCCSATRRRGCPCRPALARSTVTGPWPQPSPP